MQQHRANIRKTGNAIEKKEQDLNILLIKKDVQMTNKSMKRCLASLVQIKTIKIITKEIGV